LLVRLGAVTPLVGLGGFRIAFVRFGIGTIVLSSVSLNSKNSILPMSASEAFSEVSPKRLRSSIGGLAYLECFDRFL